MAYDYAGLAARAHGLIAKFGLDGTIRKRSRSGGYAPTVTTTDHTVKVVRTSHKIEPKEGSLTKVTNSQVYISATSGIVPGIGDALTFAGATYEIASVEPISPAGTDVVYKAMVSI